MDLSNPANLIITGIYYVITGFLILFSVFGIYILVRYGQNRIISLAISLLYAIFFLTILSQSFYTLQLIK